MQRSKGVGVFATVLVLRPQLAQPRLTPLGDCGLRNEPT
jgi:hypothetical protein